MTVAKRVGYWGTTSGSCSGHDIMPREWQEGRRERGEDRRSPCGRNKGSGLVACFDVTVHLSFSIIIIITIVVLIISINIFNVIIIYFF